MRYSKQQAFYHSRKWEEFVKLLRIQRAVNGVVICEECGQPILKSYDCIAHHTIELNEDNVEDATISLNPEYIKLIHFRCHNKLHHRFGYAQRKHKTVNLVYGAPCSGKTTFVASVAEPADLILDIDKLWAAVRADKCGEYEKPNELKNVVFSMRDNLLDTIHTRYGKWDNAYIIHELTDTPDVLMNIFEACKEFGTEDYFVEFTSTSKITFPGSGVAVLACSENNMKYIKEK